MINILTYDNYLKSISFDELEKASKECVNGIKWKEGASKFFNDRLFRISNLRQSLLDGTSIIGSYKIQKYIIFKTYDPKPRVICATRIRDRVLQRSLCNNGLYAAFTKPFIFDNLACQKGKGTTKTIERMKSHLRQFFNTAGTNKGYYLKLDIRHYFESTPHEELKKIVSYYIREPHFKCHVFQIIDSFEDCRDLNEIRKDRFGKRGIGLGSQLSQLLQLLYLNDLDHYVKEQLKVTHYLRYMDDMVLIVNSKDKAHEVFLKIKEYVENKGLKLNSKSRIGKIKDTIEFCKVRYKLTKNGKIKTKIVRKTFNREIRRINIFKKLYDVGKITIKELIQHGNTWFGFAKWRCSKKQIKYMKNYFKNTFKY